MTNGSRTRLWLPEIQLPISTDADDLLTDLWARRLVETDIEAVVEFASRAGLPASCIWLDVDDFRDFNTAYGHLQSNEVLRAIARVLSAAAVGKGRAYRNGGDEFILLLPNHSADEAAGVADRIRRDVCLLSIDGTDRRISVTLGVAAFPVSAPDAVQLLKRADDALMEAKRAGKNRVVVCQVPPEHRGSPAQIPTEELENAVGYLASKDPDVRRDAILELRRLIWRATIPATLVTSALETALPDTDSQVRLEALHTICALMDQNPEGERAALTGQFREPLMGRVLHDTVAQVRAQAMVAIGKTGSAQFIEWIISWVQSFSQEDYAATSPYVALNALASRGLLREVRTALREALERQPLDQVRLRLKEFLREVSSLAS